MDIVLFSGVTALCAVLAAMSSLIQAEMRDRRRVAYRRSFRPYAQVRRPPWAGFGRRRPSAHFAHARRRTSSAPPADLNPWAPFTVQPTTSLDDIRRQYRLLARRHHPDHGGDPRVMARINLLYAELVRRRS